jgi:exonuclease III
MNTFTVVSYNIWFDETLCTERCLSLIKKINDIDADVVSLQEVRPNVYEFLINRMKNYRYHYPKKINLSYGCAILSKYPIVQCLNIDYDNSHMGRSLMSTVISYPYHKVANDGISVENVHIVVANSHFESTFRKFNNEKLKQYETARIALDSMFQTHANVILCSDTNVMSHEEKQFEEQFDKYGWFDAWKLKGNGGNNYTYDSDDNIYLKTRHQKVKYKSRIDRILFKSTMCVIDKFSTIRANENEIEPSDHFGICAKFNIVK